jgi:hypothetical protein
LKSDQLSRPCDWTDKELVLTMRTCRFGLKSIPKHSKARSPLNRQK